MNRKLVGGFVGVIGLALLVFASESVAAQDKKAPVGIETIMKKNHGKKGRLIPAITELVNKDMVAKASAQAKQVATLAADLGKNKPKKGEQKSWDELSKAYADAAKDLSDAVEKKDADAAKSALNIINGSCKACHEAHTNRKN